MTTEVMGTTRGEAPGTTAPWIPTDEGFGTKLAMIRQRMGWGNVAVAANACGIPVETWRTWERDNVSPQNYPVVCRKIAERTGCDPVWLSGMIARSPMVRYAEVNRSATRSTSRPPDNRPSARPSSGGHGPDRRTVRLPRPDARDGA